ncbi:hypothetical protein D9758_012063 [Tetrapyrgos nigripes]|uniref:PARP catalytic domain-containing protein n=1 Tax=Tetrapyrgos nigripes TaxID=182062 RepID=A0A8H5CBQ4_9AGAR|nr:hypothetical protein D9758_012063 [Tetrapyrgos nigripes]
MPMFYLHYRSAKEVHGFFGKHRGVVITTMGGRALVSKLTQNAYPQVTQIFRESRGKIKWISFGPRGQYIIYTEKTTHSNCWFINKYDVYLRSVSFGAGGAWVVVEGNGHVRCHGLDPNIIYALKKKPVRAAQLSQSSPLFYFIEYADGEIQCNLPESWRHNIREIQEMAICHSEPSYRHEIWTPPQTVFAFGHKSDMFLVTYAWGGRHYRRNIESRAINKAVEEYGIASAFSPGFSLGENSSCFIKKGDSTWLSPLTRQTYPIVWDVWSSGVPINWVAFGPHGRYIADTKFRVYTSRSNDILGEYDRNPVSLRCASFGYGGSWVIVDHSGNVRSHGLVAGVLKKIAAGNVRNIQLSITEEKHCYVEYTDCSIDFTLPEDWHVHVANVIGVSLLGPFKPLAFSGFPLLHRIDQSEAEFFSVSSQFSMHWTYRCPKLYSIYKISPSSHSQEYRYQAYSKRIGNEQKLWHGTARLCNLGNDGLENAEPCSNYKCSLCQIIKDGYSTRRAQPTAMYGRGIYTSKTSTKASGYCSGSGLKAVLLNNVALGNIFGTDEACKSITPPIGYDSVQSVKKYDITCVYDDDAIQPVYLILYE